MGGGEVVRYLTDYGANKIAKAALISSIIPLVKKKEDNPDGVPQDALNDIKESLQKDRVGFLKEFGKGFYNYDKNKDRVSEAQLDYDFTIASLLPRGPPYRPLWPGWTPIFARNSRMSPYRH